MTNLDCLEQDVKKSEPAKRWRNKWQAALPHLCQVGPVGAGEIVWSTVEFVSRDVAETCAAGCIEYNERVAPGHLKYLGAFPLDGKDK